MNNRNLEKLVS